jgi:WD40 repeat protein
LNETPFTAETLRKTLMTDERGTMKEDRILTSRPQIEQGSVVSPQPAQVPQFIIHHSSFIVVLSLCLCVSVARDLPAQLESVESGAPASITWTSLGQVEGHLALQYSPAGAFSPDSSSLAVVVENKVLLMDLSGGAPRALRPRIEGVSDLVIHSASFLAPGRLLILGNGVIRGKGKNPPRATPTLAFVWDSEKDVIAGKVSTLGEGGGFGTPRLFPMIGYIGMYKEGTFDLWHALTGKSGRINVASLTRQPNLYEMSPDGHWLLLAQLEGGGGADPVVVDMRTGAFVDALRGPQGTTLCMAFSRDNQRVVTAGEDGMVRVWSAGGWKILFTLAGHNGTVSWAEFSPDGRWIVSGGYDKTVRVWSAADGALVQTLTEATEPVRTVAFSPNGEFITGSGEELVWIWKASRH